MYFTGINAVTVRICGILLIFFGSSFNEAKYQYNIKHFKTEIDHFGFVNNDKFDLRYLINSTFWSKHSGPIFFYTGNEADIELFAQNTGFMWDIAPKFKALLVFAEHRYYGSSLPFGNKSFSDLEYTGYFSSEQALADFASLIHHLKLTLKAENSPVIAFGGSYGGMLAAWLRMKYPHLVQGSIAASAPILQFPGLTPCDAFFRIITADFNSTSHQCAKSIQKSWAAINNVTSTSDGKKWLTDSWKLCTALNSTENVTDLKDWLVDVYTNLAMVSYPYPASFLQPLPAFPIKSVCKHLLNSELSEKVLLQALFKAVTVYFNGTGVEKCLDVKKEASTLDDRGWDFQSCTEMVMPMCSNGKTDMFEPKKWNFTDVSDSCYKKMKVRPREYMAPIMYGGKNIKAASNIVFSNGLLDPWSSGGVLKNITDSVVSILIPEGAHHLDLRAANPNDPSSVIKARNLEKKYIQKWIDEYKQQQ